MTSLAEILRRAPTQQAQVHQVRPYIDMYHCPNCDALPERTGTDFHTKEFRSTYPCGAVLQWQFPVCEGMIWAPNSVRSCTATIDHWNHDRWDWWLVREGAK